MKKRVLSLVLAVVMLVSLLIGCGNAAGGDSASSADGQRKIGVIFYSKDDALGQSVYSCLNYAAEALENVKIEWNIAGTEATEQIAAVENLISAGCEGILIIPMTDVVTQRAAQACEEAGVKLALCFRTIGDEAIREQVEAMECYVGQCAEDEAGTAQAMVEYMAEQGYGEFGLGYINPSEVLKVRNEGFDAGMEETGTKKLAEYTIPTSGDTQTHISSVENFISSYATLDAILCASASQGAGEAITNTLLSRGNGKVKLAAFDTFDGMYDGFEEGVIACLAGGMYPDALFSFMALYNEVDGNPLSEEPIALYQNYLLIRSADECETFDKYVSDPEFRIYDAETIKNMAVRYNEELTLEKLQELQGEFSMDYVKEQID